MRDLALKGARCLALASALLALFCSPAPAAGPRPLVVGVLLPMTGSVAAYGQMAWAGIQLGHRLRPTALGRPVNLVLVDNKSDSVEAASGISRLLKKDGAVAILGPATSSRALAAAPVAEQAQVPLITPTATNPNVTQGRRYVFRVCFIDPFQGQVAARYAFQKLGARRAAVLIDVGQDYAVGLAAFFTREFTRLGGKVVAQAKCNTGDQDFSAQLGTIQTAQPDLLYLPNYYTEDALVARQAQELGLRVPMLSGDGAQAPELLKIGGPAVEGLAFSTHFHPAGATGPLARRFLEVYEQGRAAGEIKEEFTSFHALGADSYLVLVDALERAGTAEGPKLRQALASTKDFEGVSGRINIGEDGNAVKSAVILKVDKGGFAYVTTMEP